MNAPELHDTHVQAWREHRQTVVPPVTVTTFTDHGARKKQEYTLPWDELTARLQTPKTYPSKDKCPWLKLATFGDKRTEAKALRHDANVTAITGIGGDYDGEKMSMEEAAALLTGARLEAVLYTSPSHTPGKPRWRVLCPTSTPLPPDERKLLVARLNGALGGVLSTESFALSQSYYYGRVNDAVYETLQTRGGSCIDQCTDLPEVYPPDKPSGNGADKGTPDTKWSTDRNKRMVSYAGALYRTGLVKGEAELLAALRARNMRICEPPLPDSELVAMVRSAVANFKAVTEATELPMPLVYTIADMAKRVRVIREWVVNQWIPSLTSVAFGGHGGSGKSLVAAMLAVCVSAGVAFYGWAVTRGPVVIYACEDNVDTWNERLRSAAKSLHVKFESLSITVIDALECERDPVLFAPTLDGRSAALTSTCVWLGEQVKAAGATLVILDAATDTFGGDEIRRREVRHYLRAVQRELKTTVLHILHIDKVASRGAATADLYSGSTDWNNGVRARLAFYRPRAEGKKEEADEDDNAPTRLELQKANYAKRGAYVDLQYDEKQNVFVRVSGSDEVGTPIDWQQRTPDDRTILRALAAAEDAGDPVLSSSNSPRNAAVRLTADNALPKPFRSKVGKTKLFAQLLRFKAAKLLAEDAVKRPSGTRPVDVWRVTAKGRAEMVEPVTTPPAPTASDPCELRHG